MPGIVRATAILAAFSALTFAPGLAKAADLGGDCCADLESRIAGLEATTAHKGNKTVSLTISGRVHANMMYWNDHAAVLDPDQPLDQSSDVYIGNTAGSETHLVFSGAGKISSDLSAGFLMTIRDDFVNGADTQISHQTGNLVTGDTTYIYLKSAKWGEYRLGNLPSASDDAYYVDFGAPGTVGGLSGGRFVGTFFLRAGNKPGELTDVTYGHVLGELGDSNENRLMYISPVWNGFTYKSDIGSNTGSVGLTWTGSAASFRAAFGAGYEISRKADAISPGGGQSVQSVSTATAPLTDINNDTLRQLALSASAIETGSGLFLTGEYSRAYAAIAGRDDATNWYVRTGWTKNVTGMGATTIDAQYERTDNKLANGTAAHLWGIGVDQAIDAVASNIYVHYQHDSFDTSGVITAASAAGSPTECMDGVPICTVDAQAIDSVTAGMVVNF